MRLADKANKNISVPETSNLLQVPEPSFSLSTPTEGMSLSTPKPSPLGEFAMSGSGAGSSAATMGAGMSKVVGSGAFKEQQKPESL